MGPFGTIGNKENLPNLINSQMLPQSAQRNKNLEKLFTVKYDFEKSERFTFLTFKELKLCVLCGSVAMNFSG